MRERQYYEQSNDRVLPADYAGDLLLWDIDKTYLDTHFSSLRGLLRIPLEFAVDKRAIPGAVPLLRALRRGAGAHNAVVPLYFVSGSPPQLRAVIERKMTLDGVDFDGVTFKDQLGLLRDRRLRDVKGQVGYKLQALLSYAAVIPPAARWLLFGDDVEADADIFALFGEVCAGLRDSELSRCLLRYGVSRPDRARIAQLAAALGVRDDPVARIFIHLERNTSPTAFTNPRTVPTKSYLQTACVLAEMNRVRPDAVVAVARDMRRRGVAEATIQEHVRDAQQRLGVSVQTARLGLA